MFFKKPLTFSILPLGTGNDLSRALGWGEGYTGDVEISEIINQIKIAEHVYLDRFFTSPLFRMHVQHYLWHD